MAALSHEGGLTPAAERTSNIEHPTSNAEQRTSYEFCDVVAQIPGRYPLPVRRAMRLRPGQKMHVVEYEGRIELIPERDIAELRGFLKGINTEIERKEDRV